MDLSSFSVFETPDDPGGVAMRLVLFLLFAISIAACGGSSGGAPSRASDPSVPGRDREADTFNFPDGEGGKTVSVRTDFTEGQRHSWRGDHAFYADWMDPEIAFEGGQSPSPLVEGRKAFELRGSNVPVILFMYLTRELGPADGLQPETVYDVRFRVRFLSAASRDCIGFGGSPGDMNLYVGALRTAPAKFKDDEGLWVLDPDPAFDTRSYRMISDIHNGQACDPSLEKFVAVTRESTEPIRAKTDAKGRLHLVIGTGGGFMGETRLFFEAVDVQLSLVEAATQP